LYNSKAYNGSTSDEAHAFANRALLNTKEGGLGYQVYTIPDGQKLVGTNFKLNPNATLGYSDGEYYYTPDNWYNEAFDKGNLRQEYNVTISGSSDKLNYYISAGYLEDSGIIPSSGFTRFSGLSKADYQVKDWFKVGANVGITHYNIEAPGSQTSWGSTGNLFYTANLIAPIYPMYVRNADGSIKVDHRGLTVYDFGGSSTNFTRPGFSPSNPLGSVALDTYNDYADVVLSKWYAIFTPIEGLTLTANLGANIINQRYNNLYNQFYGNAVSAEGMAAVEHDRDFDVNTQFLGNYIKTIEDVHNIDILVGYESYSRKMQQLGGSRQQLYDPYIGELSNGIQWPPTEMYSSTDRYATEGFLSRLQYDYDGKYFLSGSYRRDASSRFHKDNRWGNFGSAGAAWLISKENFLNEIHWIDMLKLKASYGIQGNDRILDRSGYDNFYPYTNQFKVANSNNEFSLVQNFTGNKDLTWETSYSFNTGIDFGLFNDRLNGTIEYFNRKTEDLLYYQPQPLSSGIDFKPLNVGTINNRGYEVDLNGVVFKNNDIEWSLYANATHVKNKILDLVDELKKNGGEKGSNYIYTVGGSLYTLYMVKAAGVDQETGKMLYYTDPDNGDMTTTDIYTDAKQSNLGETLPNLYGGFGTNVKAYGFDFSVQLAYQLGGKLYDGSYAEIMHSGQGSLAGHNWHKDILNSWTPENHSTTVPRLAASDDSYQVQSSRFVVSSDYLSLNNIVLGYTIPKKLLQKLNISSLRVYASGDNLALFTARQGLDPRTSIGLGSSTTSGNYRYSALRTISGGISITF
jgi:TonB-linked SusC/RagA family outer membrane protein